LKNFEKITLSLRRLSLQHLRLLYRCHKTVQQTAVGGPYYDGEFTEEVYYTVAFRMGQKKGCNVFRDISRRESVIFSNTSSNSLDEKQR